MADIVIDVCVINLFSGSAREFLLKTYTLYVLHTTNIFRGVQIAPVIFKNLGLAIYGTLVSPRQSAKI